MLVLGLIGKRACGKNLFADYLKDKYRFSLLDFTRHVLTPALGKQGREVTRRNLTALAMRLRKRYGEDILTRRLCRGIDKRSRKNIVISGVRFPGEAAFLHRSFGEGFKLIALEADPRLRYERARKRAKKGEKTLTFQGFMKLETLPTERVIPKTMELADFVIANNKAPRHLYKKIDSLVENLVK